MTKPCSVWTRADSSPAMGGIAGAFQREDKSLRRLVNAHLARFRVFCETR